MKRLLEKKWFTYLLFFLYGSLVTIFMYYPTFALDGYCQLSYGYNDYGQIFSKSGRFITSAIWKFFGFININANFLSIMAHLLSIAFLAYASFEIYNCLKKYINDSKITRIILLLGSLLVIFNPFTQGILVFEESFCMALSVMLSVIAARIIGEEINKKNYIISVLLMLCANLLYQGTISFYIPFVMLISFFKNKNDDFSTYVKKNFKSIVIYASVFLLGCVIEYALLHLYLKIFNYSSGKVGKVYIIQNIKLIIDMFFTILSTLRSMMFPLMFNISWILLLLFITSRCVIDFKNKYKYIIYSLVVLILTLASPFIPNIMMPTNDNYTAPRLLLSFGAGVGFLSLCSLLIFDKKDKNLNNYYHILVLIITCVFFICSSNSILYNSYKDYQRYRYDVEYLNDFKDVINKYELDNNTKIKEIYFSTKSVKKPNYLGVHYNINNIRVASSNWGFVCGVNGLINRDYKVTKMDNDIYEKMVEDNESIIFDGDKLFILLE